MVSSVPVGVASIDRVRSRERRPTLVLVGQWLDPAETAANVNWVKETHDALAAVTT
jgi:hypothetical protein